MYYIRIYHNIAKT
jgi:hypothetical protein